MYGDTKPYQTKPSHFLPFLHSVFDYFQKPNIFGIQYSNISQNRRYSVFGIWSDLTTCDNTGEQAHGSRTIKQIQGGTQNQARTLHLGTLCPLNYVICLKASRSLF